MDILKTSVAHDDDVIPGPGGGGDIVDDFLHLDKYPAFFPQ